MLFIRFLAHVLIISTMATHPSFSVSLKIDFSLPMRGCLLEHLCEKCAVLLGVGDAWREFYGDRSPLQQPWYYAMMASKTYTGAALDYLMDNLCFSCAVVTSCDKLWIQRHHRAIRGKIGISAYLAVKRVNQSHLMEIYEPDEVVVVTATPLVVKSAKRRILYTPEPKDISPAQDPDAVFIADTQIEDTIESTP